MVGFTPCPLLPGVTAPKYPLNRRKVGPTAGVDVLIKRKIS
jgi:hypothetical protein